MDSPSKPTGETLIVHHVPLVHCHVSNAHQFSPRKRNRNPFSCPENLGLSRTMSLPERDILQREALVYSSLIQTSSSSSSEGDGGMKAGRGSVASDTSSTSSNSEEQPHAPLEKTHGSRRNPFLIDPDEDEEGDDDDLRGYLEDSSFHLHGDSPPFHLHQVDFPEPFLLHCADRSLQGAAESRDSSQRLLRSHGQRRHGSSGSTFSMDCGEEEDGCRGSSRSAAHCSCCSDSSCNSSDGVLVNFSTIYNKMNNVVAATPLVHISSSASSPSGNGAFYLDLHSSPSQSLTRELDANCNSYQPESEGTAGDLSSCLVPATQNYYKLVTCDLSSQSSPSPAGSSATSCSEQSKASPAQPTEYFLFQKMPENEDTDLLDNSVAVDQSGFHSLEADVYVNISARPRSRSYDRHLDKSPSPRLGSLERMLSCPVRLSEKARTSSPPAPRVVTSFAEMARNKRRNGGSEGTSSGEFSPVMEGLAPCHSCDLPSPHRPWVAPLRKPPGGATAQGGLTLSADSSPSVLRYSKDQRPTSLPIQPFTFHHQFGQTQTKPLLPLLDEYISHMQARGAAEAEGGEDDPHSTLAAPCGAPTAARPSPLGSYSPIRLQCAPGSPRGPRPPPLLSRPVSTARAAPLPPTPPPLLLPAPPGRAHCFHLPSSAQLEPAPQEDLDDVLPVSVIQRPANGHHLSPQALKWREYRRRNPLGLERGKPSLSFSSDVEQKRARTRVARRNVFDFPPAEPSLGFMPFNGLPHCYSNFLPDSSSQTERPPEEFCLSPDTSADLSLSVDLRQKRGLVKAINRAVDLIVAHFGTSRDAGVKAKLGNSWVSPNVGHLILKYLCPAVADILQDGLRAFVLDLIVGQRKNQPWSVVEASTQLGPSTRVLHSLFSKVSQFPELTNHRMRFNAFIFGLLNVHSLEFWFNHIHTREDIVAAHYQAWGFLPLAHGPCRPLFQELLLLLQPLTMLPFHLDLLFEPHLLLQSREHLRRKEQLCSASQGLDQSECSTFQLMRADSQEVEQDERVCVREREGPTSRKTGVGKVCEKEKRKEKDEDVAKQRWWFQLMQSSQVYIDNSSEGSKFVKWEKKKKEGSWEKPRQSHPPLREGVVEGAEAIQQVEEPSRSSRGKPSWMGSPPESVLAELRKREGARPECQDAGSRAGLDGSTQALRWGRLFGAAKNEQNQVRKPKLPSGWLSLDRWVLDLVAQSIGMGKKADPQHPVPSSAQPAQTHRQTSWQVKALCHHQAAEPAQLSFQKGDVLQVLGRTDADWLLCGLGEVQGLVPILYVTLMEESQGRL